MSQIKWEFVSHIFGSICHISCRNPLILRDFFAVQTPHSMAYFGVYLFCKQRGGRGQNCFHRLPWAYANPRRVGPGGQNVLNARWGELALKIAIGKLGLLTPQSEDFL